MKNFKKVIAILVAVVTLFAMTVPSFAKLSSDVSYKFDIKLLDEDGNEVTTVNPGDTVYIGGYFYDKNAPSTDIEITKSGANMLMMGFIIPNGLFTEITEGMDEVDITSVATLSMDGSFTTCAVTDAGDGTSVWVNDVNVANVAYTTNASTALIKGKFTVAGSADGDYEISFLEELMTLSDTDLAPDFECGTATLTVEEDNPTLDAPTATEKITTVEMSNGEETDTYTDIFEGIYTLTPGGATATKFGVKVQGATETKTFAKTGTFEGAGSFVYRLALLGVKSLEDLTTTPFAE